MKELSNDQVRLWYDEERKQINGRNKTDQNNQPAFYTKSKRGLKKAWEMLELSFNWDHRNRPMEMGEAMNVLERYGVRTHSWCMMD